MLCIVTSPPDIFGTLKHRDELIQAGAGLVVGPLRVSGLRGICEAAVGAAGGSGAGPLKEAERTVQ